MRLVVVSAGTSAPSSTRLLADRIASATLAAHDARREGPRGDEPTISVEVIDLVEHATAMSQRLAQGLPDARFDAALSAVGTADGLVAVTPVYNASYSGLFKMFIDLTDAGTFRGVPVVIGATGGTPRHSLVLDHALRPLFAYLGADVVPTGVYAAAQDWGTAGDGGDELPERVRRAGRELAARMGSSAEDRTLHVVAQPARRAVPGETLVPFAQHLASLAPPDQESAGLRQV